MCWNSIWERKDGQRKVIACTGGEDESTGPRKEWYIQVPWIWEKRWYWCKKGTAKSKERNKETYRITGQATPEWQEPNEGN